MFEYAQMEFKNENRLNKTIDHYRAWKLLKTKHGKLIIISKKKREPYPAHFLYLILDQENMQKNGTQRMQSWCREEE